MWTYCLQTPIQACFYIFLHYLVYPLEYECKNSVKKAMSKNSGSKNICSASTTCACACACSESTTSVYPSVICSDAIQGVVLLGVIFLFYWLDSFPIYSPMDT